MIKLTPDLAGEFLSKQSFEEGRLERGNGSSWANHRADAFCSLVAGRVGFSKAQDRLVVHVDYEALARGWTDLDP